jgi:hypothetical protein
VRARFRTRPRVRPRTRSRTRAAPRVALPLPAMPPAKRSAAAMASSPPVVSAASLTTLHQVLSCFLEPCPQGTSAVGAAKVYWHPIVDTLASIMGVGACNGRRRSMGRMTSYYDMCVVVCYYFWVPIISDPSF